MPKVQIMGFGGEVPRTSATMLRDTDAQIASNARLYAGELRAWRGLRQDYVPATPSVGTIFRLRNPSDPQNPVWLTWTAEVDVARNPGADAGELRTYYTGEEKPKKTNWTLATTGAGDYPRGWLYMGVPAPATKPTVAINPTGSATAQETRFYVYTYISEFGSLQEESAPSPPSDPITVNIGDSVDVSAFAAPPGANYNITKRRIYRTITGEISGGYAFVAEIPLATTTYNDDLLAAALGETLITVGWSPPPDGMKGLVAMANGMLAGFVDNTVYFCEPFFPHAWPLRYAQTVPDRIIGLASFGSTLVVMTTGHPYVMTGISPDAMTVEKVPLAEPCVAKRSIAADNQGVVYASQNGLVAIGPNFQGVVTNGLFRRNDWQEYAPTSLRGTLFDGKYIGAFQSPQHGNRAMVISRDDHPALSFLDIDAAAVHTDVEESEAYLLKLADNRVYQIDADELRPLTYEWKSKRFVLPRAVSFSVLKLDIDTRQQGDTDLYLELLEEIEAQNQNIFANQPLAGGLNAAPIHTFEINGDNLLPFPPLASQLTATVIIYGENGAEQAVFSIDDQDPIRINPFKTRELEVLITGTINVHSLQLATSMVELKTP